MKRHPPLSIAQIHARLRVDLATGRCVWIDAGKHQARFNGHEAGGPRKTTNGGSYWVIRIGGIPYKRAQIVLAVATGKWPGDMVDHENGNKLDDRAVNLRHATATLNNLNVHRRAKAAPLPMGVRALPSGKFQARVRQKSLGTYDTPGAASAAHSKLKQELIHENS